ncbi:hypothetical protein D046_8439, partial [Vibrio parahaemolyticus V-223/04]
MALSKP